MSERPLRILYLDDSATALSEVHGALSAEGHYVRTAATVGEAAPWLDVTDIVIIDFHMPGLNGAEALLALQSKVSQQPGPVYYLYTTDTSVAVRFKAHGFHGAFTEKGNAATLATQVATAARLLKMRRFVTRSNAP